MDNTEELLFMFREYLKVRGRSPATVALYSKQADCFLQTVAAGDIKAVTKSHIEAYMEALYEHKTAEGKSYSIGTICVKVRAVKRLFEYLETANVVFINPAESIREPQKPKTLPKGVLSGKEIDKILDQPNLGLMSRSARGHAQGQQGQGRQGPRGAPGPARSKMPA